jgi:hypothetical protein
MNAQIDSTTVTLNQTNFYDGDGAMVKEVDTQSNAPGSAATNYYLRSSVLGGAIVEEINASAQKQVGYVYYPGGSILATQSDGLVARKHQAPTGTTQLSTYSGAYAPFRTEFDPLGSDVSLTAPPSPPPAVDPGDIGSAHIAGIMDARYADMFNLSGGCTIDGSSASCSLAVSLLNRGLAGFAPPRAVWAGGQWNFVHLDYNTGQYVAQGAFLRYDYTSVTFEGSTSGRWHPVFQTIVFGSATNYSSFLTFLQNPTVDVPIGGTDKLKSLLDKSLAFGDCKKALDAFLAKIGQDTGVNPSHTSFTDLIDAITSQTGGGGLYADVPGESMDDHIPAAARLNRPQPSGGGGLSWFFSSL